MQPHGDVAKASPLEGVGTATSAWAADQCNRALGQATKIDEERTHSALVKAAKGRKLAPWERFKVFEPFEAVTPPKAIVDMHRVLSRKMVEEEKDAEARLAVKGYGDPDLRTG